MAIDWVAIGVQTGLFVAILAGFAYVLRLRMVKWVSLGFVRMMKKLQSDADEEGGTSPPPTSPGSFSLGGLPIGEILKALSDPGVQKLIAGFLNRGSSGGGGW